jgi:DNA-binding beta-propeller fold protein YncE
MRPASTRSTALAALLALLAVLPACAAPRDSQAHPVWPAPPAPARIKHLMSLQSPSDLERPGLLARLANLVGGSSRRTLLRPQGVAVSPDQMLYVTDQERQFVHVIDLRSGDGSVIEKAGEQYFVSPVGVAFCDGLLAVSDSKLNQVWLFAPDGALKLTLQKPGGFQRPTGLAYDRKRKLLYVVDTLADEVLAFDLGGRLVSRFGSPGTDAGEFNYPTQVFSGDDGIVYVTDSLNHRVQAFDADGRFLFYVGTLGDASGHLAVPKGVGVDSFGHIYVVDSYFSVVQVFDRQGQFLLEFGGPGSDNGAFQVPAGLAMDAQDRIYVCDSFNHRVQIFQYVGEQSDETVP